jgi:NitT/TauT family transport system permease protein
MTRRLGTPAVLLALVLAWQALYFAVGDSGLSSPAQASVRLASLMGTTGFWINAAETGRAFAAAVVISLVAGVALGTLLGMRRLSGRVFEPILVNLYALPKVTLYPVVLLVFGLGLSARVAFGVMHGMIPLTLFTMNAILQLRPVYLRAARTMRLSAWQIATTVMLPAILPEVLAGARLCVSLCLLGVLIGEMFASSRGLGFMVMNAMQLGDMATALAVALLLAAVAVAANAGLLALDRAWRRG